jgi:hypothetical protein
MFNFQALQWVKDRDLRTSSKGDSGQTHLIFCTLPVCKATLYKHFFKTEMMINRQTFGLNGQLILAQGKRSVALG